MLFHVPFFFIAMEVFVNGRAGGIVLLNYKLAIVHTSYACFNI